jgi:AcrR family transcriptional regulator
LVALASTERSVRKLFLWLIKNAVKHPVAAGNGGNLQARGQTTRLANKERRKARILSEARNLIAEEGFDALTISELAVRSEVTIPTVHNLLGKKNDIVLAVFRGLVDNIDAVLAEPDLTDPVLVSAVFIDKIVDLYGSDEVFYRAAFLGGERLGLFEHEMSDGIFAKSIRVAERLCQRALDQGYLLGRIDSALLAQQLFGAQRLPRQDWVSGYIDLATYRQRALTGMLLTFAADATPALHRRICAELLVLA